MRVLIFLMVILYTIPAYAENRDKIAITIEEKGKLLARLEQSSWMATDVMLAKYDNSVPENFGGYFSYIDNEITKCIFYSNEPIPKVIATISFTDKITTQHAETDYSERSFSTLEKEYYLLRTTAFKLINNDTFFKRYENTDLNLVPVLDGNKKEVYILTGPQIAGIVLLGNDYKLTFNKKYELIEKKLLHEKIEVVYLNDTTSLLKGSGSEAGNYETQMTGHIHKGEESEYITETDVCTLILYGKSDIWRRHIAISSTIISIWDCKEKSLIIIPKPEK